MEIGTITLRAYQKDIQQKVLNLWHLHYSVIVQMPTGTGKTHLLASIVSSELNGGSNGVWIAAHIIRRISSPKV